MVRMPSRAAREEAYRNSIGAVPGKYKKGIESTTGWKEAALGGQNLYVQKMQDQSVLARREKGLQKVSDQDWKQGALVKGAVNIASGMQAGAAKQATNYEPIAQALAALELPERTADPMQNIDNRVKRVVETAMRASGKY